MATVREIGPNIVALSRKLPGLLGGWVKNNEVYEHGFQKVNKSTFRGETSQ